jgi:cytoskeletal protein CcmA (bactofilin family)
MPARERMPAIEPPGNSRIVSGAGDVPTQSFIDSSLTIVGDLHSAGDVRIDGRICGNVRCAQLILGRDATVTGSVAAQQVIVRGRIVGTVRAPAVIIQDSAHVESEIIYCSLAIDDGAFFEGAARRRDNPLAEPEQPAAAAPAQSASIAKPGAQAGDAAQSAHTDATAQPPPLPNGKAPHANRQTPIANGHSPAG